MKIKKMMLPLASLAIISCLGSCGKDENPQKKIVMEAVEAAQNMTRDELMQKAADEIQDGVFKFTGCSSRLHKAENNFKALLATKNAACANMTFSGDKSIPDGRIYQTLAADIKANKTDCYDGFLLQDGYQLQKYAIDTGYMVNYVPKEWNDDAATDKTKNKNPFSLQYNFKTWLVNDGAGDGIKTPDGKPLDNVWDFTHSKQKLACMSPNNENVNRDFLIMLTKDENCRLLKEAYDDPSNDSDIKVEDYASYGELKKYAYAFIAGFIKRASFAGDDGDIINPLSKKTADGSAAWIVYSKMNNIEETEDVSKKFLVSPALGKDNTDGATATMNMKGFSGFMYKHYLMVSSITKHPYTTCAFINYLATTSDGFEAWGKDIGDYPSMPSVDVNRRKFGHGEFVTNEKGEKVWKQDDTKENVFPVMNDPSGDWWVNTGKAIVEDPEYLGSNYDDVNKFIIDVTAHKAS